MHHEDDPRRIVQDRRREGDAICVEFAHPVADDQPAFFLQCFCAGKERSCVPLRAHPQEHEIETRQLVCSQSETRAQIVFVLRRSFRGISLLSLDAMHLLRIDWGFGEHRFLGHAKVALRVVWGYVPFIAEEKLDLAPRYFCLQQRVAGE